MSVPKIHYRIFPETAISDETDALVGIAGRHRWRKTMLLSAFCIWSIHVLRRQIIRLSIKAAAFLCQFAPFSHACEPAPLIFEQITQSITNP